MARFYMVFLPCLMVFGIAYILLRSSSLLGPLLELNATISSALLNLLGASTEVDGALVLSSSFTFDVIAECTSLLFSCIFVAAVLAWPATMRQRIVGIGVGLVALFVLNLVRIGVLFYVGSHFPGFMDVAHYFLGQLAMVLLTLGLWLLWIKATERSTKRREAR